MNLEPSRFSSHCTLIAVLALVAGIAVTVESAAQQVGLRSIVAERAYNTIVMLPTMQDARAQSGRTQDQAEDFEFSLGEI